MIVLDNRRKEGEEYSGGEGYRASAPAPAAAVTADDTQIKPADDKVAEVEEEKPKKVKKEAKEEKKEELSADDIPF